MHLISRSWFHNTTSTTRIRIYEMSDFFRSQKRNLHILQGTAYSVIVLLFDCRTDTEYSKGVCYDISQYISSFSLMTYYQMFKTFAWLRYVDKIHNIIYIEIHLRHMGHGTPRTMPTNLTYTIVYVLQYLLISGFWLALRTWVHNVAISP